MTALAQSGFQDRVRGGGGYIYLIFDANINTLLYE